jgi:ribosomal protein S18 acetylase RimI-like enzyme
MAAVIRRYEAHDEGEVVALSVRAWAPVFASYDQVIGEELNRRLHGVWQDYQSAEVRRELADDERARWVAVDDSATVGFVTVVLHRERRIGQISMLAVDPARQGRGVGLALTEHATKWIADQQMRVASVSTGGDPGHAPARHLYEKAGYRALPSVWYFKEL